MTAPIADAIDEQLLYPDSDGQPMADNTVQYRWIVTIQGNLDVQYLYDDDVFVAGDLFWYAVKDEPTECVAPDTMVVFGRPKGDRGSYKQWEENGIAPQVVFEIRSPKNLPAHLEKKLEFYRRHKVEEYYLYDPDKVELTGYLRSAGELEEIESMHGWVSPRLQIRFDLSGPELVIWGPYDQKFLTFVELGRQAKLAQQRAEQERREREEAQARAKLAQQRADQEQQEREEAQARAKLAQQSAEQERREREEAQAQTKLAQQRADQEHQEREEAHARAERLAARLRELGIDPES
jgi:Uma2 family endonuclease